MNNQYDAIVVGSGPNGLAAAITLARARLSVLVIEARDEPGGGMRSAPLTLPGFVHDVCSAIHPLGVASPFLRSLPLAEHGLEWTHSPVPLAHPLDGGNAATLDRSLEATARALGSDGPAYEHLMHSLVARWEELFPEILQPMLHWPSKFGPLISFGRQGIRSAFGMATDHFEGAPARALVAGLAAHSFLRLEQRGSAAFALVLGVLGHAVGWPMAKGGSGQIARAMASYFKQLGGRIETGHLVKHVDELPPARAILLDVSPRQLLAMADRRLPPQYSDALRRFRPGPGVFKIDYALSDPVPWLSPACRQAATIHLGGTLEEIAASESAVARGEHPRQPFVLLAQQTLFDPSRAPAGRHTAWAYCHVPNGSDVDMTSHIEAQIERFAPGFKDCILTRHARNCRALENDNPNLIGGDINGGSANLWQLLARPVLSFVPYKTPAPGLFLCSASTPPGGGVHGMCGYHAARHALEFLEHDSPGVAHAQPRAK